MSAAAPCSCGRPSAVVIPDAGSHLCERCLARLVEGRLKAELVRHRLIGRGERVGFALSGGKDSTTAMAVVHKLLRRRRDLSFVAITIDEGIEGYRALGVAAARASCARLGIPHEVRAFEDAFGLTVDEVASRDGELGPCTYCGVLRRRLLNSAARELGVDVLVLGHNADDEAQSVLMNLFRGDDRRLLGMGPGERAAADPAWVRRVRPLRGVMERESAAYAISQGLPIELAECPHSRRAFRLVVRDALKGLEHRYPGTAHTVVATADRLLAPLRERPPAAMGSCSRCGEPSSGDPCKACGLLERARGLGCAGARAPAPPDRPRGA